MQLNVIFVDWISPELQKVCIFMQREGTSFKPGQVVHTCVPLFTKQYKLVLVQAGN